MILLQDLVTLKPVDNIDENKRVTIKTFVTRLSLYTLFYTTIVTLTPWKLSCTAAIIRFFLRKYSKQFLLFRFFFKLFKFLDNCFFRINIIRQ